MKFIERFYVGQRVVTDFTGPAHPMYDIEEGQFRLTEDNVIRKNFVSVVIDSFVENKNLQWVKILTSHGSTGYAPSIWVKSV